MGGLVIKRGRCGIPRDQTGFEASDRNHGFANSCTTVDSVRSGTRLITGFAIIHTKFVLKLFHSIRSTSETELTCQSEHVQTPRNILGK